MRNGGADRGRLHRLLDADPGGPAGAVEQLAAPRPQPTQGQHGAVLTNPWPPPANSSLDRSTPVESSADVSGVDVTLQRAPSFDGIQHLPPQHPYYALHAVPNLGVLGSIIVRVGIAWFRATHRSMGRASPRKTP